jgi:HEPN superfamily protein
VPAPDVPPIDRSPDESVVGAYFSRLNEILEDDKNPKSVAAAFVQQLKAKHSISALETMTEMDRLYREMRSVLNEFTGRGYFLVHILTVEHLATAMKLYVISWHTMLDLLARLVNAVFNLGIADRDVTPRLILTNAHVKATRIPEILAAYEKALPVEDLRKRRNDAVHRGRIPDPDVEQLLKERNTLDSRRYSLLTISPISEEEYKNGTAALQTRLNAMAKEKQSLWEQIHQQTSAMTSAVASELAVKAIERLKREAI